MNREQKRKSIKSLTAKGYTKEQAEALTMLKATQEIKKFLKEGDRVKLNIPQMKSRPEWKSEVDQNKARFQAWVLAHQDVILTVEYDKKYQNNPSIVCVVEDETDPKYINDDECPWCIDCDETDSWECNCCSLWHDWIGDEEFDPMDI